MTQITDDALTALRSRVSGPVLARGDGDLAREVAGFNVVVAHDPDVVVGAASEADVVEAVRFAREHRLPITIHATGHGADRSTDAGLVLTTSRLVHVAVDAETCTATLGAGVRWSAVVQAAAPLGLAPITGSAATVGAVGFLLGGGLGPLARSHGFASDRVRRYTVVTASGDVVTASADQNPELFWALRGGKVGLGVVTEAQVELVPIPSLYAGGLFFAAEHIEVALRAWVDWTEDVDDAVTSSAAILRFPDLPFVPDPFRGRTVLHVRVAFPGPVADGERLTAPLRAAAPVYVDALGPLPLTDVALIHNDPREPVPVWDFGRFLDPVDQDLVSSLLAQVGPDVASPFLSVELRHLGAATVDDVPEGSAVGGRGAAYSLVLIGAPDPSLFAEVLPQAEARLSGAVSAWTRVETNVNFAGGGALSDPQRFASLWSLDTVSRLARVRADWDPDGVFSGAWAAPRG